MKKTFVMLSMAVLAIVACQKQSGGRTNNGGNVDVVIEDVKLEGEGKLVHIDVDSHAEITTNSTYKWSATEENGIQIEINVDTKQYIEGDGTEDGISAGDFQIGTFVLPLADINEFLGISATETLTPGNFAPVCEYAGSASGWTSYMPGMWLNNDGLGCGWSEGNAFWQWYIWGGKTFTIGENETTVSYDLNDDGNYDNFKGLMYIGGNPSNTKKSGGKTIKSHNVMKIGKEVNFDVTIKFSAYDAPVDNTVGHSEPQGEAFLLDADGNELETTLSWDITSSGLFFEAELSIGGLGLELAEGSETEYVGGPYAIGYVKFDIDFLSEVVGKDFASLTKDDFYPVDQDGNKLVKQYTGADLTEGDTTGWTTWGDVPGEWVLADGRLSNWSAGAAYWWMNFEDRSHDFDIVGSLVIGNGPAGLHTVGMEVVSYNMCCGKPFNVTIKYVE